VEREASSVTVGEDPTGANGSALVTKPVKDGLKVVRLPGRVLRVVEREVADRKDKLVKERDKVHRVRSRTVST
jgi:serine acetyltransferase